MKAFIWPLITLMLVACSNTEKQVQTKTLIKLSTKAEDTIVVIYNHGTRNPRKKERCDASYNQVPDSLKGLESNRLRIYYLCSNATEGAGPEHAGNQVYARMYEIEKTIDELIKLGVRPKHIFLAGHSKGAWASLMLMNQVNQKFNAAILFAPALANRRSEQTHPWWRAEVRPRQIHQMLQAREIDALIFAYEEDQYNRPQDIEFLTEKYPMSVEIVAYRCDYEFTHNTHLHDCRQPQTSKMIAEYIDQQVIDWRL